MADGTLHTGSPTGRRTSASREANGAGKSEVRLPSLQTSFQAATFTSSPLALLTTEPRPQPHCCNGEPQDTAAQDVQSETSSALRLADSSTCPQRRFAHFAPPQRPGPQEFAVQPTMSSAAATSSAHATIVNGLSEEDKQASPWRLFPPGHNPNQYNAQTPGPCTPAHSARPRAQATIKLFKAYDDDGNGELDFDEFKQVRGRLWFATGCGGFAGAGAGVRGTSWAHARCVTLAPCTAR